MRCFKFLLKSMIFILFLLEVHSRLELPVIKLYGQDWLPELPGTDIKLAGTVALYPLVLYRNKQSEVPWDIKVHEGAHIRDIYKEGYTTFVVKYLYHHYNVGYHDNPYEKRAERVEQEYYEKYIQERF